MNRRDWLGGLLVASNISKQNALAIGAHYPVESHSIGEASLNAASSLETPERIYELLGFATMTGEDPLTMWARLKNTQTWLAGPLSPDAWCGQCFIADNIDIFALAVMVASNRP
jgi:hypothetical protein